MVTSKTSPAIFFTLGFHCLSQYLGIVVRGGYLEKQVRGFSVLARLYTETQQLSKAQEYYHNVSLTTLATTHCIHV